MNEWGIKQAYVSLCSQSSYVYLFSSGDVQF